MMPTNSLSRVTVVLMMILIAVGYYGSIAILGSAKAIEIGNVMVLALATGIVVAYAPVAWQAMKHDPIDGANILSLGIFTSWAGVLVARGVSIIWRLAGQPVDWLNSGWWGIHIALSCIGGLYHIVAPEAVAGRVPTKHWIRIGLLVAFAVLAVAGLNAIFNDG